MGAADDMVWSRMQSLLDQVDERRARRLRVELGRRQWLVSWLAEPDGRGWRARVSCPGLDATVERVGATRCRAIEQACKAVELLMDMARARVAHWHSRDR